MKSARPRTGLRVVSGTVRGVVDAVADTAEAALPRRRDGRSERWAEHRVSRRNELIDAAIRAVRRYGASVGMDQIAAAARTSKPVIYRYFADKTDLYSAVGQRVAGDLVRDVTAALSAAPDLRARMRAGIDAYLKMLEESPELYQFVVGHAESPGPDFSSSVAELTTVQLADVLRGLGLDPARAEPWGTSMVGFIRSAGQWWLTHREQMTRSELADYLSTLLWGGVAGLGPANDGTAKDGPASDGTAGDGAAKDGAVPDVFRGRDRRP